MPRKEKTAASVAQNRHNQRRSRARQREVLDEMRRKLEYFEKAGVQATLEMQRAAQQVAGQNHRLRLMLLLGGAKPSQIEDFLALSDRELDECCSSSLWGSPTARVAASLRPLVPELRLEQASSSIIPAARDEKPSYRQDNREEHPVGAGADEPQCSNVRNDTTSCVAAANIIAELKGDMDTAQALVALGCAQNRECQVKNTNLMELMDEFA